MPTNSTGLGIGLQSDLGAATRLWSQDYNRKANAIAANKRDKDLTNQKQSDYINKYLNTANSGLHPMYQPEVKKQSVAYLQKIAANPDYARTNEGIMEFQNVITYVDKAQQATKNIEKTAEIVLGHPDDMTIDESINDVVSRGDLEGFKKLNGGNEFYELGLGTKGVMNLNEMNKFANQRAYGNPEPDPRVRKVGDLMIADEVIKANLANHKADALLYYESHPFAAKEWENKGGFEAAYKMLEQPTDKYKTIYTGQVQKSKGSGSGDDINKSGNVVAKEIINTDGTVDYTWTGTGLAYEDNKVTIPTEIATKNNPKYNEGEIVDYVVVNRPQVKFHPKKNLIELKGDFYAKDGKTKIAAPAKRFFDLRDDSAKEILKQIESLSNQTISFASGKPEIVKGAAQLKQSKTVKAADVKMQKAAPAKKTAMPTYVTEKGETVDMTGASEADIQKLVKMGKIKPAQQKKSSNNPAPNQQSIKSNPIIKTSAKDNTVVPPSTIKKTEAKNAVIQTNGSGVSPKESQSIQVNKKDNENLQVEPQTKNDVVDVSQNIPSKKEQAGKTNFVAKSLNISEDDVYKNPDYNNILNIHKDYFSGDDNLIKSAKEKARVIYTDKSLWDKKVDETNKAIDEYNKKYPNKKQDKLPYRTQDEINESWKHLIKYDDQRSFETLLKELLNALSE